jgi:hypothetical protein
VALNALTVTVYISFDIFMFQALANPDYHIGLVQSGPHPHLIENYNDIADKLLKSWR